MPPLLETTCRPSSSREAALLTVLVLIAVAALTYDVTCFKRSGGKDASDRPDSRGVVQVSSGRRDF